MMRRITNLAVALAVVIALGHLLLPGRDARAQKTGVYITYLKSLVLTEGHLQVRGEGSSTTDTVTASISAASTDFDIVNDVSGNEPINCSVSGSGAICDFGTPGTTAGDGTRIQADSAGGVVISDTILSSADIDALGLAYSYDIDAGTAKGLLIGTTTLSSGAAAIATGNTRTFVGCSVTRLAAATTAVGGTGEGTRTFTIDDGSGSATDDVFYICETTGSVGG